MINRSLIFNFLIFIFFIGGTASQCSQPEKAQESSQEATSIQDSSKTAQALAKPSYHFSPGKGKMLQPDAALYHRGRYHVFYQYADSSSTQSLGWGRAVSSDLVHWEEQPAISFKSIDSSMLAGTVIAANQHTSVCSSNEPSGCLLSVYISRQDHKQYLNLAHSNDQGQSFTPLANNPVQELEHNDLEDPKVFWHKDSEQWVLLAVQPEKHSVVFYTSPDLLTWEFKHDFGPAGDTSGAWRFPDLYELPVENKLGSSKWVLQVAAGNQTQYFVGRFNGGKFVNEYPDEQILYVDNGADYTGAITMGNMPQGENRVVSIGWLGNSKYVESMPDSLSPGAMSIPRKLLLRKQEDGIRLVQQPIEEIKELRGKRVGANLLTAEELTAFLAKRKVDGRAVEIEVEVDVKKADEFGFNIFKGQESEIKVGYDVKDEVLFVDRSQSGDHELNQLLPSHYATHLPVVDGRVKLRIMIDHHTVEVFGNDDYKGITCIVLPGAKGHSIEMYDRGGDVEVFAVSVWQMLPSKVESVALNGGRWIKTAILKTFNS